MEQDRWVGFGEYDLKRKVQRVEVIDRTLVALTESFQLIDVSTGRLLMEKVHDFACDKGNIIVCRQPSKRFRFERYVWPELDQPEESSNSFGSVVERLSVSSKQVAGCVNKTQVVLWTFGSKKPMCVGKLDGPVSGLHFDREGRLVVREGVVQPQCRVWSKGEWSVQGDVVPELQCQFGDDKIEASERVLLVVEPKKKRRKIVLMELGNLQYFCGVESLFGGRAFVTLQDCGQLILWFSRTEKKVLCKPDPNFRFVAEQLTVGTDAEGYPFIAYVMNDKTVRIFSINQYVEK